MKKKQFGFTILELLIVMTIMVIIVTISIVNHHKMGRHIQLENTAYNIAITIREAQVYGIHKKVREAAIPVFGASYRYGVYFNRTNSVPGISNNQFIIYLDRENDADNQFTDLGSLNCTGVVNDECYSQILLTAGNHISGIYFYESGGWNSSNKDSADISFMRPNPDAQILNEDGEVRAKVRVVIQDKFQEITRCIDIGVAGSISVRANENCDV